MANKDIAKDEELVTPVNRDYIIVRKKHNTFEKASCSDNERQQKRKPSSLLSFLYSDIQLAAKE
jgi:hypothetical protein